MSIPNGVATRTAIHLVTNGIKQTQQICIVWVSLDVRYNIIIHNALPDSSINRKNEEVSGVIPNLREQQFKFFLYILCGDFQGLNMHILSPSDCTIHFRYTTTRE